MVKNSPVYPNYETSDYVDYEFDPQVDFLQFLEEAKQHAREVNCRTSLPHSEEAGKGNQEEGKRSKKSWKNSLFKWWKAEKKGKPAMEPANASHISNPRKGHVFSGPIYGSDRVFSTRNWRPASGQLTSLFNSSRKGENEVPYMCLDQLNSPDVVKTYGPVYMVT